MPNKYDVLFQRSTVSYMIGDVEFLMQKCSMGEFEDLDAIAKARDEQSAIPKIREILANSLVDEHGNHITSAEELKRVDADRLIAMFETLRDASQPVLKKT